MVEWNASNLLILLQELVSSRSSKVYRDPAVVAKAEKQVLARTSSIVIDEISQVLPMPAFPTHRSEALRLDNDVKTQLYRFISNIARLYRDVPFHNFERTY